MLRLLSPSLLSLALILPLGVRADPVAPGERAMDRKELRQDRRETTDDLYDRARLGKIRKAYAAARASGNPAMILSVEKRLALFVKQEIREGSREAASDRQELRRSRREEARSRKARRAGRAGTAAVRGDKRDRQDDRRDLAVENASRKHILGLATELEGLMGKTDPASLDRKTAILDELVRTQNRELSRDAAEKREDLREKREDR